MKLEKLSAEQERVMIETRDYWIDLAHNQKEIDKVKFEKGINWLYQDLLKKDKPRIVYCDSWLSCLITINILKNIKGASVRASVRASVGASVGASVWASVEDSVEDSVWASVDASVRDSVRDSVWASVRDSVGASVWASVRDSVGASVRASVRDSVGDSVRASVSASVRASVGASVSASVGASVGDSVGASVGDSVRDSVGDSVRDSVGASVRDKELYDIFKEYSYYTGFADYAWVSFYDFFIKIGVINHNLFNNYKNLIQSNSFQNYMYDNIVFAIQPPSVIIKNQEGRLNDVNNMAVRFKDGTGYYFINGRNITTELFSKLKKDEYTLQDFISEDNEEIKSACISYLQQTKGDDYLVNFFRENLKEVNTFVDKKDEKYLEGTTKGMNVGVYTLFKGEINNTNIAYVRCYCPSTDRMFFLGVSSEHDNAKDAIASLYRIPKKLKPYIKEINRQGERYSTLLTKEGKALVKSLPKNDIEDLVSINGNEYFSKIKYEY